MRKIFTMGLILVLSFSLIYADDDKSYSKWAENEIKKGISLELIPRDLQSKYKENINRRDFCKLAVYIVSLKFGGEKFIDKYKENLNNVPFKDINVNLQDDLYIAIAYKLGIVNGKSETLFAPNDLITREEAAKMLLSTRNIILKMIYQDFEADNEVNYTYISNFSDDGYISNWAVDYVGGVVRFKIMNGMDNGEFSPKSNYTREQAYISSVRLFFNINKAIKEYPTSSGIG